uniref:Uncharacterized protein n=1 Tax=Strigops habroptila TaxID=2489341 RepID=A0A672UCZ9_STRHB
GPVNGTRRKQELESSVTRNNDTSTSQSIRDAPAQGMAPEHLGGIRLAHLSPAHGPPSRPPTGTITPWHTWTKGTCPCGPAYGSPLVLAALLAAEM